MSIREGGKEVKDLEDWAAIQKVYKSTKSKRATASMLGISRNTVKKLLAMKKPPVYCRTEYTSKIDRFKEKIIEWRCEPYCFNGTRIFRELRNCGYDGSIGPVYYYLRKVDEDIGDSISKKATTRIETPPWGSGTVRLVRVPDSHSRQVQDSILLLTDTGSFKEEGGMLLVKGRC